MAKKKDHGKGTAWSGRDPYSLKELMLLGTKKDAFFGAYTESTKSKMVVAVKLPTGIELITNTDNLDGKMEYYRNAYDDDLQLKANPEIKIINYMFV